MINKPCEVCMGTGLYNNNREIECPACQGFGMQHAFTNREILCGKDTTKVAELIYRLCDDCFFCSNTDCNIHDPSLCAHANEYDVINNIKLWLEEEYEE